MHLLIACVCVCVCVCVIFNYCMKAMLQQALSTIDNVMEESGMEVRKEKKGEIERDSTV